MSAIPIGILTPTNSPFCSVGPTESIVFPSAIPTPMATRIHITRKRSRNERPRRGGGGGLDESPLSVLRCQLPFQEDYQLEKCVHTCGVEIQFFFASFFNIFTRVACSSVLVLYYCAAFDGVHFVSRCVFRSILFRIVGVNDIHDLCFDEENYSTNQRGSMTFHCKYARLLASFSPSLHSHFYH